MERFIYPSMLGIDADELMIVRQKIYPNQKLYPFGYKIKKFWI